MDVIQDEKDDEFLHLPKSKGKKGKKEKKVNFNSSNLDLIKQTTNN